MSSSKIKKTNFIIGFVKGILVFIAELIILPFEIIEELVIKIKEILLFRKEKKANRDELRNSYQQTSFSRKILHEINRLTRESPLVQLIDNFFSFVSTLTIISLILIGSTFIVSSYISGIESIDSLYSQEFLFTLTLMPITLFVYVLILVIKYVISKNKFDFKGVESILMGVSLLCFFVSLPSFYINYPKKITVIVIIIMIQLICFFFQICISIIFIFVFLIYRFFYLSRDIIIDFEKTIRNLYNNMTKLLKSDNITVNENNESILKDLTEDDFTFFLNRKSYFLRIKCYFDEIFQLLSKNVDNMLLNEWLIESLGETSVVDSHINSINLIKIFIEFINAFKLYIDEDYKQSIDSFKVIINLWDDMQIRRIKNLRRLFKREIYFLEMLTEPNPTGKTNKIYLIASTNCKIYNSFWKKDYRSFFDCVTNKIYFYTRKARGGDEPELIKHSKKMLKKLKKYLCDSELSLYSFHEELINCVDHYTQAGLEFSESKPFHRNAIKAFYDAKSYYDTVQTLISYDFIAEDTLDEIEIKILDEPTRKPKEGKNRQLIFNLLISGLIAFITYDIVEVVIGEHWLLKISTTMQITLGIIAVILILILDLLKGKNSIIKHSFNRIRYL